jgi:hypothetical protein
MFKELFREEKIERSIYVSRPLRRYDPCPAIPTLHGIFLHKNHSPSQINGPVTPVQLHTVLSALALELLHLIRKWEIDNFAL